MAMTYVIHKIIIYPALLIVFLFTLLWSIGCILMIKKIRKREAQNFEEAENKKAQLKFFYWSFASSITFALMALIYIIIP
jgi:hypothetical protein